MKMDDQDDSSFSSWYPIKPAYSKTVNNRTRGANAHYQGDAGGPGTVFCSPGADLLVIVAVVACYYVYYH